MQNFELIRLTKETQINSFNSTDSDLNDFLLNDSKNFLEELLAVTYLIQTSDQVIAYFSLLNDKINLTTVANSERNKFNRQMPNPKRMSNYPAIKIGRLAVSENFEKMRFGRNIINLIKDKFTSSNAGCRFITVDAYAAAFDFYKKNGFKFLTKEDENETTRLMYFDLKRHSLNRQEIKN